VIADHPIACSYWALHGELLAGPHPGLGDRPAQRETVRALWEAGIRTIVDLTTPGERPAIRVLWEKLAGDASAWAWLGYPIFDGGAPSRAGMQLILDAIDASIARGRAVYVHCMGGLGRTGTVVGCWWIRHALVEPPRVFEELMVRRRGQPNAHAISPETPAQFELVRSWRQHD
jgi:hypothetical protein